MSDEKETEETQVGERKKKRKNSTFTFEYGDFTYDLLSLKHLDRSVFNVSYAYEYAALRAMEEHYAFYGQAAKIEGYVTRNAVIHCSCGNRDIRLDTCKDHGVIAANGEAVLTCNVCHEDINIYRFGLCDAEVKYGKLSALRPSGEKEINEAGIMCYRCMPVLAEKWRQKEGDLLVWDAGSEEFVEALKAGAYLTCRYGGIITIEELAENRNTEELAEEAYQVLRQWLLEGHEIISQEKLAAAMEELAVTGDINKISCLNEPIIPENNGEKTDEEKIEIEMLERIKSCMSIQDKYDVMVLAWINYWNMTMKNKYDGAYAHIRPDIIKAMILDESNFGQENTIKRITQNPERDIMQSLDPRNPLIWVVIGKEPNEYIVIQRAESDVKDLKIEKEEKVKAKTGEPGAGQVGFFESGSFKAAKEIVSEDLQIYYAEKVTPELSLAIGVGYYCMNLNGTMDTSLMRSEVAAIKKYNGNGDKNYVKKINVILDNMGVKQLEE